MTGASDRTARPAGTGEGAGSGLGAGAGSGAGEPLTDEFVKLPILAADTVYQGMVWDVVSEDVDLGQAGTVRREFVRHTGAVCVLALDEQDRVLLIHQYRHPVRMRLWELPAGLLDIAGEPPLVAAARELAEEADLVAQEWAVLVDWFNSPGGMNEALRCYLARGVSEVAAELRHQRTAEELGMPTRWVPLDQARAAVLAGRIHNPGTVVGVLAACAARDAGWSTLRPADAPWPEHPLLRP